MNRAPFSYEDMIFENRNKSYGAYDLRVNYQTNLMKSFFIGIGGITLIAFIIYKITDNPILPTQIHTQTTVFDFNKTFEIEPEKKVPALPDMNNVKPATALPSKQIADPNSFQLVSRVIEPVKPIEPDPAPLPIEPIGEPLAAAGPAVIPVNPVPGRIGSGSDLGTTILTSAAVDKLPMFPGGMEGFYNFLSKHMRFPQEARNEGISGKLFVSFVINKDGNLVDIEFVKKAGFGMEESVMAVLEKSPKWTPGLVGNQQVNTKMVLPVTFNLVQ